MTRNDLEDKEIEDLFRAMPDIQDTRTKDEILMKLKQENRLHDTNKRSDRKKRSSKWIPALIALSAILLVGLLLPSMLNNNNNESADLAPLTKSSDEDKDDVQMESETASEEDIAKSELIEVEESDLVELNKEFDGYFRAVYPSDVQNGTVFHLGLASDAAASLPVTFIIPEEEIELAFGEREPSSFDLYEQYATKIDEEALGFTEYHPYKGSISVEGDLVIQTLPPNHGYDMASATMETFLGTLQDTFYDFEKIEFVNEDGSPVEFDQVGEPSEPIPLTSVANQFNYYVFKQDNGEEFLSSNFRKSHERIEIALNEMKKEPNDIYEPVIPEALNFELTKDKELLTIAFNDPLDFEDLEVKEAQQMIDAILLTAASFNEQVQFENVVQTEWNGFNFKKPLPIPIGANFMPFLLKQ